MYYRKVDRKFVEQMLAARKMICYHGTSSKFLRSILKTGLVPDSKKKVWDENYNKTDDRDLRSFPGIYLSQNFMTSYSAGNNAKRKFGGNCVMIVADITLTSQDTGLDEDGITYIISSEMANACHKQGLAEIEHSDSIQMLFIDDSSFRKQLIKDSYDGFRARFKENVEPRHHRKCDYLFDQLKPDFERMFFFRVFDWANKDIWRNAKIKGTEDRPKGDADPKTLVVSLWGKPSKKLIVPIGDGYSRPKFKRYHFEAPHRKYMEKIINTLGKLLRGFSQSAMKETLGIASSIKVDNVGYKGHNKILGIFELIDPDYKREKEEREPYKIVQHYLKDKKAFEQFIKEYRMSITSEFVLEKAQ